MFPNSPPWPKDQLIERRWAPEGGRSDGRALRPYRYHAFLPLPIATKEYPLTAPLAQAVVEAERACLELNQNPPMASNLEGLARHLLRAESVASSRIEGLILSHRRLARAFLSEKHRDLNAQSVVANVLATEKAVALATQNEDVSLETILTIHRTLLEGTREERFAGIVRQEQNWIGGRADGPLGADFVPPPEDKLPEALKDLCVFMNRTDLPASLQAAVAHAQFETLHPFIDGNGRVGRALIHLVLRRRRLAARYVPPVSLALAGRADRYVHGLTAYRLGHEESWFLLFCDALSSSAGRSRTFAEDILHLQQTWSEKAGHPRPHSAPKKLIDRLPAYPVIDIQTAQSVTGLEREACRLAVLRLEKANILREITLSRRNRAWETVGLFDLLDRFERALGPHSRTPPPTRHE